MHPPEAVEVAALVPQLQLTPSQIINIEHQMDAAIERWRQAPKKAQPLETNSDSFSDMEILRSIPDVGRNVLALCRPKPLRHLNEETTKR